jgi:predicted nucleotidyltransferase component of viral defense system
MPPTTQAEIIECFHLAFLTALTQRVDPASIALKGGANLRYFFGSVRYSEDIDFDVVLGADWKLRDQVNGILNSPALLLLLRSSQISIEQLNESKQTATTQRWKLLLATPRAARAISTKVEFSRRNGDQRWQVDQVPERVVAPYALRPPTVLHYLAPAATQQKIDALALRSETQARDVFDLELLFRTHPGVVAQGTVANERLQAAIDRALELPFAAFEAQVVPFLEPAIADGYHDPAVWQQIQEYVGDRLLELLT